METAQTPILRESQYPVFFVRREVDEQREPVFHRLVANGREDRVFRLPPSLTWRRLKDICYPEIAAQVAPIYFASHLDDYLARFEFSPAEATKCAARLGGTQLVTGEISPYKEVHETLTLLGEGQLERAAQALASLERPLSAPIQCLQAKIFIWRDRKPEAMRILKATVGIGGQTARR